MITLDDWTWNPDNILLEHEVTVEYYNDSAGDAGWTLSWKHGCMLIGQVEKSIAREAAALFISLWNRDISASFADKLMQGYILYLLRVKELQQS
jgi:hypothetical protein